MINFVLKVYPNLDKVDNKLSQKLILKYFFILNKDLFSKYLKYQTT